MPVSKHWIAVSAVSALGIGMLATSAIGVANAIPLVDSSSASDVPPISTVPGDAKGTIGSGTVTFPVPASTAAPASVPAVEQAPAPQPVAPQPAAPASAASIDSVDSPASAD